MCLAAPYGGVLGLLMPGSSWARTFNPRISARTQEHLAAVDRDGCAPAPHHLRSGYLDLVLDLTFEAGSTCRSWVEMKVHMTSGVGRTRGDRPCEQSVNNCPNTKDQQVLGGITGTVVINQRTNVCRIPGARRVPSELQARRTRESRHLH